MVSMTIGRRLTLWYGAIWTLSLVVLSAALYATFAHNQRAEIDRALDEELVEIEIEVVNATDAATRDRQLEKYFGRHPYYAVQVSRPDGEVIFASESLRQTALPAPDSSADASQMSVGDVAFADGREFRVASRLVQAFDGPVVIQAGDSLAQYNSALSRLMTVLLWLMPASIAVALAIGYWLSRRALAPVDRLTSAAVRISASRLGERVDVSLADDELSRLATAFNSMLGRLQQSFQEMQQFTADAAHELRTPLAVLRTEADVALQSARSPEEYRTVLENQVDGIARMTGLVDQLLFLCREDAGVETMSAPIPVGAFVSDLVEDLQPLADDRGLTLACNPLPACQVSIDSDRLRRLFCNLLDNAIKYTPSGGRVTVSGVCKGDSAEIVIADTGVGVTKEQAPHLFQRFYRGATSRGVVSGSGLGLAICDVVARRHGGRIAINSKPGQGTRVVVTLPTAVSNGFPESAEFPER